MRKNYSFALMAFFCAIFFSFGQLSPGDIAFVQYNADGTDNFAFVALTDIPASETIIFTDNEEDDLTGGEGTIVWTSPAGGVSCGTVVVITTSPSASVGSVSESNDLNFSASGDSIIAYQGTAASPSFIAALNNEGANGGAFGGANGTLLPAGLTNGTDAVDLVEVDNAAYNGAVLTGTRAAILAAINDYTNWTLTSDSVQQTFSGTFTADCTLSTSVEFASVTYTAGENNATAQLCVNIASESATAATNVNVVLTSASAPHVTYATQTVTFPAASSAQQCVTINLNQNTNCGDTTDYIFELQSVTGGNSAIIGANNQTTLTVNDDDGTFGPFRTLSFETGDDWGYTPAGGSVSSITNKFFGTQSYELTGTNRITMDNVDISTYTNVTLSVAFAAVGPDSDDDLWMDISYDNGVTWPGANRIKLVDGFGNADIDIGDTNALNPTTVASNPYTIAIPATETQIQIRLRAAGLDAGDYYYVDDIILSGNTCVVPCTPTHTVSNFVPNSGPAGTEVTITGSGFTGLTDVEFNGISSTNVVFIDANTLIAEVPNGATTGEITVIENSCPIDTSDFTVILNNGSCGSLNTLIMTEIYDHASGSLGYIEVYNGTGAAINLTNYFIRRYGSAANYAVNDYTDYTFTPGVNIINDGEILVGKISSDADVISAPQGPDFPFGNAGFSGINGDDIFELRNNSGVIDVYQVPNNNVGYTALRSVTTAGANPATPGGNPSDWSHNTTENTSDLGLYPFVGLSNFPSADISPVDVTTCASQAVFDVVASPGDGGTLAYQWYYNEGDGVSNTWSLVTPGDFPLCISVTGENTNQLILGSGFANYNNYQFYCLITENGACSEASDAAQIKLDVAVWSTSGWSTLPSIDKVAIITDDYDTNVGTGNQDSFEACRLIVNSGVTLTVHDGDYVDVVNDVIVNGNTALDFGEIVINPKGAFIQRGDDSFAGDFTLVGTGRSKVTKRTAPLINWYDYTYWSSPVVDALVSNALFSANPNRRFWYNSNNYNDSDNDDIDDEGDDWVLVDTSNPSENLMTSGRGYAATHSTVGFMSGNTGYLYDFEGALQTGNVSYPLAYNAANTDHWNLVGNPYPSSIDVDLLFLMNTSIKDVVYLWSHHRPPLGTNPGNEVLNFDQNDYILFNTAMPVGNGSDINGDGVVNAADVPEKYIPSGQSFFVSSTSASPIVFKNSLRRTGDDSNNQFFRINESAQNSNSNVDNKLWINLSSDTGAYSQTGIAYMQEATDGFDGIGYDTKRNRTVNSAASIYTLIADRPDLIFGIQAKAKQSLSLDEVLPLGFTTQLSEPSIYTIKLLKTTGEFLSIHNTYLKDKHLDLVHNLSESDYVFTSDPGEFNNRFEIVFQPEALSVSENTISSNELSIIELNDGNVKFSVGQQLRITKVDIYDVVGRLVYQLEGDANEEVFDLSRLSHSAYITKVTLSNGQVITKKALKSN